LQVPLTIIALVLLEMPRIFSSQLLLVLRLLLSAMSGIVAATPLRALRSVRLSVVVEERLLTFDLTDHQCPERAERRIDCPLGQ
jgi:hypothetical protein